jgi:hypothetical protein
VPGFVGVVWSSLHRELMTLLRNRGPGAWFSEAEFDFRLRFES